MGHLDECPLCSSPESKPVSGDRQDLRACRSCGVVFNSTHKVLTYDQRYFVDDYENQYGRTYAQDEPAIRALASRRLGMIFRMAHGACPRESMRLLDIGSAMGFFLKEAREQGIGQVEGVEISSFAADYCRTTLRIPVQESSFENAALEGSFNIITAWYFIEHCPDPGPVIEKITSLLVKGGILALATPSLFGPLFRFNRREWCASHPGDHRVDFSPRTMRSFLNHNGFHHVRIRAAGIHPERIFNPRAPWFRPLAGAYSFFSSHLAFSDTMEVFALKSEN
jgi:2-polyprenyl-3-methyl-5-hydroxy-6-metoxy-1,4-benzoquinol methylase